MLYIHLLHINENDYEVLLPMPIDKENQAIF